MPLSLIDTIGKTSLIKLKLQEESRASVFAKLEMHNPFGMKDRVAKNMIMEAKKRGELKDGAPIVESSSGTLAMGITLVGTYLGHEVNIVTDPRIDRLTYTKLKALGAKVHIVSEMGQNGGWQQARLDYVYKMIEKNPNIYWPRQYENRQNPLAYESLAADLIHELGKVDILVGSVGSGGSLCGAAAALKTYDPHLKVVAVDAVGSTIFHQTDQPARLQGGLGNSLHPPNVDYSLIDEVHWLNDQEAFSWTWKLARHEKVFAGNSSGSVYAVANWISTVENSNTVIACIFPDRGDRYANTIYSEDFLNKYNIDTACLNYNPSHIKEIEDVDMWSYIDFMKGKCLDGKIAVY
ncbi:cysteine synthase family protein [Oceanobacillus sp. FSL H7-0719]|uniref:cysteine synthase family protein n=1 Tax=Oceanobacillus sp. FSL H7-0719 TaxID=2954507 RepID=UPI00324D6A57